jgi:arsenate reductase
VQTDNRKRVLFVCLGNICRSPMAMALANKYGSDVLVATSAGVTPALNTSPLTRTTLEDRNIDLGEHLPRGLKEVELTNVDLIVNMSGRSLPTNGRPPVENWEVPDPIGGDAAKYRASCDLIEMQVMRLIVRIRAGKI